MARNTSSRSSSSASARSSRPQMTQTRQSSTAAAPPATPQPVYVPQQQQQQGILSQIATTAAGVAVGHTVGRMITGMFGGSAEPPMQQQQQSMQNMQNMQNMQQLQQPTAQFYQNSNPQCQEYSNLFLRCMSENGNQVGLCSDYMEMMKSCQQQQMQLN